MAYGSHRARKDIRGRDGNDCADEGEAEEEGNEGTVLTICEPERRWLTAIEDGEYNETTLRAV